MTENIKTIWDLVEKDNKKIGDVKRMIKDFGVYHLNWCEEWEAAPKDLSSSDKIIKKAIAALKYYADIHFGRVSEEDLRDYYSDDRAPLIARFGFHQDESGNLLVKNTHIQTLEEQIENLTEDNKRLDGFYEAKVNKELVAPELELANQVNREALKKLDRKTNKVEGVTPFKWMQDRLQKIDSTLGDATKKRIASVANWHNKQSNIPNK